MYNRRSIIDDGGRVAEPTALSSPLNDVRTDFAVHGLAEAGSKYQPENALSAEVRPEN